MTYEIDIEQKVQELLASKSDKNWAHYSGIESGMGIA